MRRGLLAVALLLAFAGSAQARPNVTQAAMHRAYAWWHTQPCHATVLFGDFGSGWGMASARNPCLVAVNTRYWTPQIMRWIRTDHYRGHDRPGPWGIDLGGPIGVDYWRYFCDSMVIEVGGMLGHPLSSDPTSPMFHGDAGENGVERFCGTSPYQ